MEYYANNRVNLTTINSKELARILGLDKNPLALKHEDCCLVWLPSAGVLYAIDRDDLTVCRNNIFAKGNFAEVVRSYYEDVTELVTMFEGAMELNPILNGIIVSDIFDNHSMSLQELVKELKTDKD